MGYVMKAFFGLILLANVGYAETDWNQLIKLSPNAQVKEGIIDSRFKELKYVELPDGRIRFDQFTKLANRFKFKLSIHSKRNIVKDACSDFAGLGKSFKAELKITRSELPSIFTFKNAQGKQYSSDQFENKIKISEIFSKGLTSYDETPWITMTKKFSANESASTYVRDVFNAAIKSSKGEVITIDLTSHNGIACDLAYANIRPVFYRTIESEKALPDRQYWITKDNFNALSNMYNYELELIEKKAATKATESQKNILIGWSFSELKLEKTSTIIWNTKDRFSLLKNALKSHDWNDSLELVRPVELNVKVDAPISSSDVWVDIGE